jgi:hypothetical protein
MWSDGLSTLDIATAIGDNIRQQQGKLRTADGTPWPDQWYIPYPSASLVRYVLERTLPDDDIKERRDLYPFPGEWRWRCILPANVAHRQACWERARQIHRMRSLGIDTNSIAKRFSVSRVRINQLLQKQPATRSPIEMFILAGAADIDALRRSLRLRRWASKMRDSDFKLFTNADPDGI